MNYIIEDNIDFFNELNKNDIEVNSDNKCLITNEILMNDFVELKCKHKFNYYPLFMDIFNQKINSEFILETSY